MLKIVFTLLPLAATATVGRSSARWAEESKEGITVEHVPAGDSDEALHDNYEARCAFGLAQLNEKNYEAAAATLITGLDMLPPPPLDQLALRVAADARLGLARALTKLARFEPALEQLNALHAASAELPAPHRLRTQSSIKAERAAVLACAGRLDEAVNEKKDALLGMDQLLQAAGDGTDVQAEGRFAAECAELSRLLMWAGNTDEAMEVAAMAVSVSAESGGGWSDPQQLPSGKFVPGLAASPWHDSVSPETGKRRLRKAARPLAPALKILEAESAASLASEFQELVDRNLVKEQNECLHTGDGQWSYTAVWGAHATVQVQDEGDDGCNPMTPVACRLAAKLRRGHSFRLVRLGYSAVDASTHIRPHFGPTNSQIKAHLGLVVPTGPKGKDCTTLRVAGVERSWAPGQAIVFDDSFLHEVWNNCSTQRVVLQAVFAHPDLYPTSRDNERKAEL